MRSVPLFLPLSGSAFLVACLALAFTEAPLGTPLFFVLAGIMTAAYVAALARVWTGPGPSRRWLTWVYLLAIAFRLPLAILPVGADSDMVRYLWDGRVQRLGVNPYVAVPADPALEHTHTEQTRQMPSRRVRTPYPPGAQLFFRAVTAVHDSTLAMKLAVVACDLITIFVVRRWLFVTGRNPWLVLAYAWNPLVVLEAAHSGHIDAVGAMWLALAALALTTRRTLAAALAFVVAVATKLLPIVLIPLFWRRVRLRDAALAAVAIPAMLLPFMDGTSLPLGALPGVVAGVRFNGPLFMGIRLLTSPPFAAAVAVIAGLGVAAWCRRHLPADDPAAWAWPMAIALAFAPVVYPWYLLYMTPFLLARATIPLIAWTFSVIPAYIVWELARHGGRWRVPAAVVIVEYVVLAAAALIVFRRRSRTAEFAA